MTFWRILLLRSAMAAAAAGGTYLLMATRRLASQPDRRTAMAAFHASLIQLTLLLAAAIVDASVHG